jgi:hypothetical protein
VPQRTTGCLSGALLTVPRITYRGLVPFCIRTKDEEGNDFSEWDGSTLDGGLNPSKYANKNVTVYGSGSYYCIKMTRHQVAELYWRAKGIVTEVTMASPAVASGSASASGDYDAGGSTDPETGIYTPSWAQESASASVGSGTASECFGITPVCIRSFEGVCDLAVFRKSNLKLADIYQKRINQPIDETKLVCGPSSSWDFAGFLKSNDESAALSPYASFVDSNAISSADTSEHGAASAGFNIQTDVLSFFGLSFVGPGGDSLENNIPITRIDSYFPKFQFIQTGRDEYWWNPSLKVVSLFNLTGGASGSDHNGGNGNVSGSISAHTMSPQIGWTPATTNAPPPLTDPSSNGTNIESVTIKVTFSDGSVVTGEQFLLQQVTNGTDSNGNPTAGNSVSLISENGRSTVTMSIDPSVLIPDKISLSFYKYYTYGAVYDEDTGFLS